MEKAQPLVYTKIEQTKQLLAVRGRRRSHKTLALRYCMSCPNLIPETRVKPCLPFRHLSPPRTKPVSYDPINPYIKYSASPVYPVCPPCLLQPQIGQVTTKRAYSKPCACGCPCPFPCGPCGCPGGCGCLPPPCNQPPRCIQYMTGYYYYPYGFWFCGPYHVAGTCTPVSSCGPCAPCGPCGPCCKCPPACVCPAAAAVVSAQSATDPKSSLKCNIVPNSQTNFPLRDTTGTTAQQPRSGIAKFFPFNASVAPGTNATAKDSKHKMPPMPPMMSSFVCAYSTQTPNRRPTRKEAATYCIPNVNRNRHNSFNMDQNMPCVVSNNKFSKPFSTISTRTFSRSLSAYDNMKSKSPIRHKRARIYIPEICPSLDKPRVLETRDKPRIRPGAFDFKSVPK